MKRFALIGLLLTIGCTTHTPPSLSPAGARLYQANEVVVAIGTLQHAAIELNKVQVCPQPTSCHPLLVDADTRVVVDASTTALTTLKATPDGWKAAATALLTQIESRLDAAGKTQLAAYLQVVRTMAGV